MTTEYPSIFCDFTTIITPSKSYLSYSDGILSLDSAKLVAPTDKGTTPITLTVKSYQNSVTQ